MLRCCCARSAALGQQCRETCFLFSSLQINSGQTDAWKITSVLPQGGKVTAWKYFLCFPLQEKPTAACIVHGCSEIRGISIYIPSGSDAFLLLKRGCNLLLLRGSRLLPSVLPAFRFIQFLFSETGFDVAQAGLELDV